MKNKNRKNAQIFAEFAIIMPVYLLFLMCFIQLIMIMHAKYMIDYAAFCAARAGVVSKGDQLYMREAAATVLAPLFEKQGEGLERILSGKAKCLSKMAKVKHGGMVFPASLYLLNNNGDQDTYRDKLNNANSLSELSQDEKLLKVRVDYEFPLNVPVANKFLASIMAGFINQKNTLDGEWMYKKNVENYFANYNPNILLSSECHMRLTTLEEPS